RHVKTRHVLEFYQRHWPETESLQDPNLEQLLVEAAALQAILDAAGIDVRSLLDLATPRHLSDLSSRSPAAQHALLRNAAACLDEPPSPRSAAARTRTQTFLHTPVAALTPTPPPSTFRTTAPGR
ncbi:hypothetical protein ACFVVU_37470, partial [Kitasatospora sp. NPDC057965]|uniref:hypothetical protein n=1 Tax=Kitasatospora sp. NPDC057965 TaxID=3346291 RepID=UPI0036DA507E